MYLYIDLSYGLFLPLREYCIVVVLIQFTNRTEQWHRYFFAVVAPATFVLYTTLS